MQPVSSELNFIQNSLALHSMVYQKILYWIFFQVYQCMFIKTNHYRLLIIMAWSSKSCLYRFCAISFVVFCCQRVRADICKGGYHGSKGSMPWRKKKNFKKRGLVNYVTREGGRGYNNNNIPFWYRAFHMVITYLCMITILRASKRLWILILPWLQLRYRRAPNIQGIHSTR